MSSKTQPASRHSLSLLKSLKSLCNNSDTLSRRVQGEDFSEVPDDKSTLTFLINLGYKGLLHKHPNMGNVNYPKLIWEDFAFQIDHRIEKQRRRENMPYPRIGEDFQEYGLPIPRNTLTEKIKQSESYQMFIKYSTGLIPLKKSRGKGLKGKKAPVSPKPVSVKVSNKSDSKHARKQTGSKRVIKKKVLIFIEDNIIPEPDFALELGKSMSLTEAAEEEATRLVRATHERIMTESNTKPARRRLSEKLPADTMQELKANIKSSRSQPLTEGSSEGTNTKPGFPDESIDDRIYSNDEEEKKDDDDDKCINLKETDNEETDDVYVQDDEYVHDDEHVHGKDDEEMKDAEDAYIGKDVEINSLLDIKIQYEVLHIQSPSMLTIPVLVIPELSILLPIRKTTTTASPVISTITLVLQQQSTPISTSPITTEALIFSTAKLIELEQEPTKSTSEILKVKKEQADKQKMTKYTIKSTDKAELNDEKGHMVMRMKTLLLDQTRVRRLRGQEPKSQSHLKRHPPPRKPLEVKLQLKEPWFNNLLSAKKDPLTFDALMDTLIDFSKFAMNRIKIDKLTKAHLVGPVYKLLKGTCKSNIELEYNMEKILSMVSVKVKKLHGYGHLEEIVVRKADR
nr:hypothetical protein [Tanacetum cinerariifolium]